MNDTQKDSDLSIGNQIDNLYQLRADRMMKGKEVEELKKEETSRVKAIMSTQEKMGANSLSGQVATFSLTETTVPKTVDFKALREYIMDTGHIHLLGTRVSAPAFRELIGLGEEVPGVESYTFNKHSLTRSKK